MHEVVIKTEIARIFSPFLAAGWRDLVALGHNVSQGRLFGPLLLNHSCHIEIFSHVCKSIKVHIRHVAINWARASKLRRCDASLRQKLVQLLGDTYTLAVSNAPVLLQSQRNRSFAKKKKKEDAGDRFTCSSQLISCYSGMSAVGDIYSHPETTT